MSQLDVLATALNYIESNLEGSISTPDIAASCYCSKSTLERLFRYINNISIRDYIVRRRMALAARDLSNDTSIKLIDVGIRYGYSTNESFTRAFEQVWHTSPSEYRRNPRKYILFPRLTCPITKGDIYMTKKKNVDISELYDLFRERTDCYFVCCDIKSLMPINDISREAGDLAIIESLNRMYDVASEDDVVFRIGGDEFVLLTNSSDEAYAESIQAKIEARNEEPIHYNGTSIPLSLHVTVVQPSLTVPKYSDLFTNLHKAIDASKY